jgi:DNA processing protein
MPLLNVAMPETNHRDTEQEKNDWSPDKQYHDLLGMIGYDPLNIEEIISKSGLTPESVSSMLLLLELHGYVETLSGNRYCRLSTGSI